MIEVVDFKNDYWKLTPGSYRPFSLYLHKGDAYWKIWMKVHTGPRELRNYPEIPLPVFTDWWSKVN